VNDPKFDEVIFLQTEGDKEFALVIHRDPQGNDFAWHSPLKDGAVSCSICKDGARVYMDAGESDG
jgi:hypothetical protein